MLKQKFNEILTGETLENALEFADFLDANEMSFGDGIVSYKGEHVCYMHLDNGNEYPSPWTIWTAGEYCTELVDFPITEEIKMAAWENINNCGNCGAGCNPGSRKMIFGKEFDGVCSADMDFYQPNAKTLACVKRLLEMRKHIIDNGQNYQNGVVLI